MKRLPIVLVLLLTPRFCSAFEPKKPNILVVMTDDLDDMTFKATPGLAEIADQGIRFDMQVSAPVCAVNRASALSGNFPHNHGVLGNSQDRWDAAFNANVVGKTFADWCQSTGYHTVMVGKYDNAFDGMTHQGWDAWIPETGRNEVQTGMFWHDAMVESAMYDIAAHPDEPKLVYYAPAIPHGPLIPSNAFAGSMSNLMLPVDPSFNELDISDKTNSEIDNLSPLTIRDYKKTQRRFQKRVEMMRSVVMGIDWLSQALNDRPLYVIFASDNGYFEGQHRMPKGKGLPYKEATVVPAFITGPDVPATKSDAMVYGMDIAPTVADLCGATHPVIDAQSMTPLFANPDQPWRNRVLLEYGWKGIRTPTRSYYRFLSGFEVYQNGTDPFEMNNTHKFPVNLDTYLDRLMTCEGLECWQIETE